MISTILIEQAKLFYKNLSTEDINYIVDNNIVIYSNNIDTNYNFSKNILLEEISWIYDNNNLRIPFWNNNKLPQIKLELNDNVSIDAPVNEGEEIDPPDELNDNTFESELTGL